jgi:hypothetical protein
MGLAVLVVRVVPVLRSTDNDSSSTLFVVVLSSLHVFQWACMLRIKAKSYNDTFPSYNFLFLISNTNSIHYVATI